MKAGNFRQFADLELLTGIGRKLLTRFLDTFADDLAVRNILPPSKELTDTEFFDLASAVLAQPEPPAFLAEALSAIEELAHPDCRENLQTALANAGIQTQAARDATPEHKAMLLWLAVPDLLARCENFTLEPIRTHGSDALIVEDVPGLKKATLRQIDISWEDVFFQVNITIADDIFDSLADHPLNLIPKGAAILHARFDLLFADSPEPRSLDLRIPHTMQLENASDETIVRRWLCQRGFRIPLSQTISRNSISHACTVGNT